MKSKYRCVPAEMNVRMENSQDFTAGDEVQPQTVGERLFHQLQRRSHPLFYTNKPTLPLKMRRVCQ